MKNTSLFQKSSRIFFGGVLEPFNPQADIINCAEISDNNGDLDHLTYGEVCLAWTFIPISHIERRHENFIWDLICYLEPPFISLGAATADVNT